jgi:hypothetical protein
MHGNKDFIREYCLNSELHLSPLVLLKLMSLKFCSDLVIGKNFFLTTNLGRDHQLITWVSIFW